MDEHEARGWRPDILGWSDDILPYYEQIAASLALNARIVEVGVFHGRSALFMVETLTRLSKQSVEFICVDAYDPCPSFLEGHVRYISNTSMNAASTFGNETLDFVFIDASHRYEDVLDDIQAWLPKVKRGGILAGHDYNTDQYTVGTQNLIVDPHPDVIRAVNESLGRLNVRVVGHSVWEFVKV